MLCYSIPLIKFQLSIVPSEVIRAEDLRAHSLEKDVLFELKHGDKIRLLNGTTTDKVKFKCIRVI